MTNKTHREWGESHLWSAESQLNSFKVMPVYFRLSSIIHIFHFLTSCEDTGTEAADVMPLAFPKTDPRDSVLSIPYR